MQYRVLWSPDAEMQLEQLLEHSSDADVVDSAARELDRQLLADASTLGESRYDTIRIGFVKPLAIQFEVMEDVRTAIVNYVWRTDRK